MRATSSFSPPRPIISHRMAGCAWLLLAALACAPSAFATAYIRFANASLQGHPATDKVQIKLNGEVLVDALGYKGASDYFDVDSGAPFLTVWFQGTKIVDRQLDIRDDRSYLFTVIGNGSTDRFNVDGDYESLLNLDESMYQFSNLMAAPYPGRPHEDDSPTTGLGVKTACSFRPNSTSTTSGGFAFSGGYFQPNFENDKGGGDPFYTPGVPIPLGTCKVELFTVSHLGWRPVPLPPGMNPTEASFVPQPGSYVNQILIGDGITAPIEWWILQHRARFVDPRPVIPGSWAAGIWTAPGVPGLAVALEVDSLATTQKLAGILFGSDRLGKTRWYRLNQSFVDPEQTYIRLYPSEYLNNFAGEVNETGNGTTLELKFLSCDRARLGLSSLYGFRLLDIAALGQDYRPIELERVTPLAENCPR